VAKDIAANRPGASGGESLEGAQPGDDPVGTLAEAAQALVFVGDRAGDGAAAPVLKHRGARLLGEQGGAMGLFGRPQGLFDRAAGLLGGVDRGVADRADRRLGGIGDVESLLDPLDQLVEQRRGRLLAEQPILRRVALGGLDQANLGFGTDELGERGEGLECLGGDVFVLDRDPEAPLQVDDQLQHGHRVELGQRPEQGRVGLERLGAPLDSQGLDQHRLDLIQPYLGAGGVVLFGIQTSTSAAGGWLRNAVGLAVSP
jgi:hypothetical protein